MLVELIDIALDLTSDIEKETVAELIDYIRQDEVECLAKTSSLVISDFIVPKLVYGEAQEDNDGNVHDNSHYQPYSLTVLQVVRRLFRIEVTNLK